MLSKSAIDLAYPVAEALANRQVILSSPGNDPITELAQCSLHDLPVAMESNSELTPTDMVGVLYDSSKHVDESLGGMNGCRHDTVIDELKTNIANTVRASISNARNVVVPLINECVKAAGARLNNSAKAALYPFDIIIFHQSELVTSPVLDELIANFRNGTTENVQFMSIPTMVPAASDIGGPLAFLSTGIERYDAIIAAYVESNGNLVHAVLTKLYSGAGSLFNTIDISNYREAEVATLVYLAARKLNVSAPPEGLNMSLIDWKGYTTKLMAQAAGAVHNAIVRFERAVAARRLVLQKPTAGAGGGTFVLNGQLANQWFQEGGSSEILFGAFVRNADMSYAGLLADRDVNQSEWNAHYRSYVAASVANLTSDVRKAVYEGVHPVLSAKYPDQLTSARLWDLCQALTPAQTEDLYGCVRKIVCAAAFANTDVEKVLNLFDQAAAENPEADNRQVALIATTRYVGQWIAGLITPHSTGY